MKKLSTFGALLILTAVGIIASPKQAHAYTAITSTWTVKLLMLVSSQTDTSVPEVSVSGITPGGSADLRQVILSTGYNSGAYFVCVDSFPLVATTGGALAIGGYTNEQYLFPPTLFLPSTATVTGLPLILDLAGSYNAGGATVRNGLVCFVQGDTTNRYWWTLKVVETPVASERR